MTIGTLAVFLFFSSCWATPCRSVAEGGRHELVLLFSIVSVCGKTPRHSNSRDKQREKKIVLTARALSLSQTPRCLNNHKNLHTVHRNGLVEGKKVENKKKTDHIKTFKHPTKKKKANSENVRTHQWNWEKMGRFMSRPFYVLCARTTRPGTEW